MHFFQLSTHHQKMDHQDDDGDDVDVVEVVVHGGAKVPRHHDIQPPFYKISVC